MARAIIFDLDGTLLNTIDDLADSMNAALERMGHPLHSAETYKKFVGDGVRLLAERALPGDARDDIDRCVELMREEYANRWSTKTRPYDGIPELLGELCGREIQLAVLSNKPHRYTVLNIEQYFAEGTFDVVFGERDGVPRKPDPAGALEIAEEFGLDPCEILYVGDTDTDMQTAVGAGMVPVGILWGFRGRDELAESGAQHLCDHPSELATLL